jgi:Domain of unknown function (DUF1918)
MHATVGDRLLLGTGAAQVGVIIGIPKDDGHPPYIVRWQADGHISMVSPDQYARVIPVSHPAGTGTEPGRAA